MNEITQVPSRVTGAGHDFSYAVWTANTQVMLTTVPWGNDYRDVVNFQTQNDLDSYLSNNGGPTAFINRMQYCRPGEPIRIDVPFNAAIQYNYLSVSNPAQPVSGDSPMKFYYFILDVKHIAPNTTEMIVQLDVWQTYKWDLEFGRCYVERGHVGIADVQAFDNYGRRHLTQPEGMDLGNEYSNERVYRKTLARAGTGNFDILVTSNLKLDTDYGSIRNPKIVTSDGNRLEGLPNAYNVYHFEGNVEFFNYIRDVGKYCPWVTQAITAVYLVPENLIRDDDIETGSYRYTYYANDGAAGAVKSGVIHKVNNIRSFETFTLGNDFRDEVMRTKLSGRYRHLKKFMTYPYMAVELTTYSGNPIILKPECIYSKGIEILQLNHVVQPGPRISFSPRKYNTVGDKGIAGTGFIEDDLSDANDPRSTDYDMGSTNNSERYDDGGDFVNVQTGLLDFPSFQVLNDGYALWAATNAHAVSYQHSAADWSQQKALQGNQTSYDNASAGIAQTAGLANIGVAQASAQNAINNNALHQTAMVGNIGSAAGGVLGAAAGGGVMGAVGAIGQIATRTANTAIQQNTNNASTALGNASNMQRAQLGIDTASQVRDTNKNYADWAAKGDYSNAIAAVNAKVQDAQLTPPSVAGQVGGNAFMLATQGWQLCAKVKMIQENAMISIGEYWLRFGYAINRFMPMPADCMTMEKFTYWQVKEFYITRGRCPENFKQTVRGIFEKGVTVWRNPDEIGMVDIADNPPIIGRYL